MERVSLKADTDGRERRCTVLEGAVNLFRKRLSADQRRLTSGETILAESRDCVEIAGSSTAVVSCVRACSSDSIPI